MDRRCVQETAIVSGAREFNMERVEELKGYVMFFFQAKDGMGDHA